MAILAPGPRVGASLVCTKGQVLWSGATADRKGLLSVGSHFQLTDEPGLFDACRTRLLWSHTGTDSLPVSDPCVWPGWGLSDGLVNDWGAGWTKFVGMASFLEIA